VGLPQKAGVVDHFEANLCERLAAYPAPTAALASPPFSLKWPSPALARTRKSG
jgi:hypothetical protein